MLPGRTTRSNSVNDTELILEMKTVLDTFKNETCRTLQYLKSEVQKISTVVESVKERVERIENNISDMKDVLTKHDSRITSIRRDLQSDVTELPKSIFNEIEERISRQNNVIISGVAENDGTIEERHEHDLEKLQCLTSEIGCSLEKSNFLKVQRVGRLSSRGPRLIRLTLADQFARKALLQKSRILRNSSSFRNVYVNPDRTKLQSSEFKKLREELHDRRSKGEDVVIFNQRVMSRQNIKSENFH